MVLVFPQLSQTFQMKKITTILDFVIEKEHSFIQNMFDHDELKLSKNIETLEKYDASFKKMLRIIVLLNTKYSKESDVENISDDHIIEFINEYDFESFEDLFLETENTHVKNSKWEDGKNFKLNKIITFAYSSIMEFPQKNLKSKYLPLKNSLTMSDILFMEDT